MWYREDIEFYLTHPNIEHQRLTIFNDLFSEKFALDCGLFFSFRKKTPIVYFILSMGECMCIHVCENNAVTEKLVTLCSGYWSISK